MQKKWQKPKLVVLTRSKPEEAVLNGCKTGDLRPYASSMGLATRCADKTWHEYPDGGGAYECTACQMRIGS